MAEKPEDFNMPLNVVANIIKQALPEGVRVSSDVRSACSRCASIFILYVTTCANNVALTHKRKTLTPQDVIDALQDIGFTEFVPQLNSFHRQLKEDKQRKQMAKKAIERSSAGQTSDLADGIPIIDLDEEESDDQQDE